MITESLINVTVTRSDGNYSTISENRVFLRDGDIVTLTGCNELTNSTYNVSNFNVSTLSFDLFSVASGATVTAAPVPTTIAAPATTTVAPVTSTNLFCKLGLTYRVSKLYTIGDVVSIDDSEGFSCGFATDKYRIHTLVKNTNGATQIQLSNIDHSKVTSSPSNAPGHCNMKVYDDMVEMIGCRTLTILQ